MQYEWDFTVVWRYHHILIAGAEGTLWLFVSAMAIAVPLGLVLCVVRLSRLPVASQIATGYTELFRAFPALVLIIWFYYALPVLVQINFSAYVAGTLALGLQSAAYMAEVFRGGIESISKGQREAAKSIGLSQSDAFRFVIFPQAIKRVLPIFFTRVIELFKTTALTAPITYLELFNAGTQVSAQTFRPIETYTVIALMYFVAIFMASLLTRRIERRLASSD